MQEIKHHVYVWLAVIVAAIGIAPLGDLSMLFGVVGNDVWTIRLLIYAYFLATTFAEIYVALIAPTFKAFQKIEQTWLYKKISSKLSNHKPVKLEYFGGFLGMVVFTAAPFCGLLAIGIFIAEYKTYSVKQKILASICFSLGYAIRVLGITGGLSMFI